jgi:hypothetical protein
VKERKKTSLIMVLLHLRVGLNLYVIPKQVSEELDYSFLLKVITLNERRQAGQHLFSPKHKSLGSHMID